MDPNANLQSQAYLIKGSLDAYAKRRLLELRQALQEWLAHGGFEPLWEEFPEASIAYHAWKQAKIHMGHIAR